MQDEEGLSDKLGRVLGRQSAPAPISWIRRWIGHGGKRISQISQSWRRPSPLKMMRSEEPE